MKHYTIHKTMQDYYRIPKFFNGGHIKNLTSLIDGFVKLAEKTKNHKLPSSYAESLSNLQKGRNAALSEGYNKLATWFKANGEGKNKIGKLTPELREIISKIGEGRRATPMFEINRKSYLERAKANPEFKKMRELWAREHSQQPAVTPSTTTETAAQTAVQNAGSTIAQSARNAAQATKSRWAKAWDWMGRHKGATITGGILLSNGSVRSGLGWGLNKWTTPVQDWGKPQTPTPQQGQAVLTLADGTQITGVMNNGAFVPSTGGIAQPDATTQGVTDADIAAAIQQASQASALGDTAGVSDGTSQLVTPVTNAQYENDLFDNDAWDQ